MYGKVRSQEVNSPALREQSGPLTVNNTATITTKRRPYGRNIALVQIVLKNPRCARGLEKNGGWWRDHQLRVPYPSQTIRI